MTLQQRPIRLLIVDADLTAAQHSRQVAETCGFMTDVVSDVVQAARSLERAPPNMVLFDVATLDGSSPESMHRLQAMLQVPVLYLQMPDAAGEEAPRNNPAALAKPVLERELYAAAQLALHREPLERELARRTESLVQGNLRSATIVCTLEVLRVLETELQKTGDVRCFFETLLERLMETTRARYAAYGVFDSQGTPQDFIVRGMSPDVVASIGSRPAGRGVLRAFYRDGRTARIADIAAHPESCGFPAHHPPMRSLLGLPVQMEGRTLGIIYLADKNGGAPFTDWDETVAQIYTAEAAHVLQRNTLVSELLEKQRDLERTNADLQAAYEQVEQVQAQVLQSEKMASIGQLAAGVAHEINNPVGYISSNIGSLQGYLDELFALLSSCEAVVAQLPPEHPVALYFAERRKGVDLDYLRRDIADLVRESQEGVSRVKRIVQDLKDFSHVDEGEWEWVDLHKGLESTLNVVWNELKYKAEVRKEFGDIPLVQCRSSQINQVFMNLLMNAAHAIGERGLITIRTGCGEAGCVWVEVIDTGSGIKPEHLNKIFDPFFTTKPIGKGTGLGLSVSFGIVQKHNGKIEAESELGKGTCLRVSLPVHHADDALSGKDVGFAEHI